MTHMKRIVVLAFILIITASFAYAQNWTQTYIDCVREGVVRNVALCDITGDGIPEMIDIVTKSSSSTLAIRRVTSGEAVKMTCGEFDFSSFSINRLKAVKIVSREDSSGNPCVFIRMLGASDDVRLAFTHSSGDELNCKLNIRRSTGSEKLSYYVNDSAVKPEKYLRALTAFNTSYKKTDVVPMKKITASDSAAMIKKKIKVLASSYSQDVEPNDLSLSETSLALTLGESETLSVSFTPSNAYADVKWSSSSAKIATINASGVVTGNSAGSCVITAQTASGLTAKCKVTISDVKSDAVIVDISQHNYSTSMNWAEIAENVDLLILRCGVTRTYTEPLGVGIDDSFAYFAKMCKKYEIPFGVYYYGKCSTVEEAKQEARMTWNTASGTNPLFYVYDCEEERLTKKLIETYMKTLQSLGAKKTGYYIANHLYSTYKLDTSLVDFIWIPRYSGGSPVYDCDLHQYTSTGKVEGFPGVVDMNRLTGTKSLKWFLK